MPRKRNPEALRIEKDYKSKRRQVTGVHGSRNKKDNTLSSPARPDASGKKPRAAAHHKKEIDLYQKGHTNIPSETGGGRGYETREGRGTRRGKIEREVSSITGKAPNRKATIRPISKKKREEMEKRLNPQKRSLKVPRRQKA